MGASCPLNPSICCRPWRPVVIVSLPSFGSMLSSRGYVITTLLYIIYETVPEKVPALGSGSVWHCAMRTECALGNPKLKHYPAVIAVSRSRLKLLSSVNDDNRNHPGHVLPALRSRRIHRAWR